MRALSVTPPWPYAILHCGKSIENRERWTGCAYRGPVAIHASGLPSGVASWWRHRDPERNKTWHQMGMLMDFENVIEGSQRIALDNGIEPPCTTLEDQLNSSGHIVGLVEIVGVVRPSGVMLCDVERAIVERRLTSAERVWWRGEFALVLANPRPLVTPVPCKGALGLWRVPDEVAQAVEAQLQSPEQLRSIVTEAVAEALRPPAAPKPKRRASKRALPPADPEADRQLAEDLRRRGHPVDWHGIFRGTDSDVRETGWCSTCRRDVYDGEDERHRRVA